MAKRHLVSDPAKAIEQPTALADEHCRPLERLRARRVGLAFRDLLIDALEGRLVALLPHSLRGKATIGDDRHVAEIAFSRRGLHPELTLLAQIRQDPRRTVARQASIIADREGGEQIAPLIGRKVPEQFEKRCIQHAVHRVAALDRRMPIQCHHRPGPVVHGAATKSGFTALSAAVHRCTNRV